MNELTLKPLLALGAGLAGAATVAACVCFSGFLLLSGASWQGVDPALLDALALPVLAVGLAVIALASVANGVAWSILVWKQGKRALPWMLLSLCCTLAAPYVLPLALVFFTSSPQVEDVLCLCGAPGVIAGLFVLAFWFSLPRRPATAQQQEETKPPEPELPAIRESDRSESIGAPLTQRRPTPTEATSPTSGGCLGGFVTFGLGLAVPSLAAGVILLLLHLVSILLLDAQAIVPARGNPRHWTEVLATAYLLLSPVAASVMTLVASLVLLGVVVVPRIPSRAGKVVNTILFSLLSAILSLVLGFAVVARLFTRYNPEWWR
ncbi:MAG: hypothetical protein JXM73_25630 [Anaerolineae bacterium]|nr:hypothetical protein [Anaerolineae bacterium]